MKFKKLSKLVLLVSIGLIGLSVSEQSKADSKDNNDWLYNEQYRNQYHYSAAKNWLNDPNGLLYDDSTGIYHMFYQYNPYENAWGNMSWGHATSTDMVNWSEQEVAIPELANQEWVDFTYTNTTGTLAQYGEVRYVGKPTTNWGNGESNGKKYIFSGSAILDKKNESGLGENTILAFYTSCYQVATRKNDGQDNGWGTWIGMSEIQEQHLAYSTDGGKTFQQYSPDDNSEQPQPIIPVTQMPQGDAKDFRDPKVVYDEKNEQWIMIVVAGQEAQIYTSKNLLNWEYASSIIREHDVGVGVWECPELIPMTVEGTNESKWVLSMSVQSNAYASGSGMQYMIGDLSEQGVWIPESDQTLKNPIWSDFGEDLYAGVTFSNVPDNRKVMLAWMSNWAYVSEQNTNPWYSHMTVPRELKLIKKDNYHDGYALIQQPIEELNGIEAASVTPTTESGLELTSEEAKVTNFKGKNYKIEADFSWTESDTPEYVGMYVRASDDLGKKIYVGYDLNNALAYVNRLSTGEPNISGPTRDKMNVKVNSDNKKIKLTAYVDESSIEVFINDGEYTITQVFYFRPEIIGEVETNNVAFYSENGTAKISNASITPLRSIYGNIESDQSQIELNVGDSFDPLANLAFSSVDGLGEKTSISSNDLNIISNTVNPLISGNYNVTVGVKNSSGKYQEETIPVTVSENNTVAIESIQLSVDALKTVKKGKTLKVDATTSPEGSSGNLTWTSSKTNIATVDQNGQVVAVSEGITKIKVESENGESASFTLRVTK